MKLSNNIILNNIIHCLITEDVGTELTFMAYYDVRTIYNCNISQILSEFILYYLHNSSKYKYLYYEKYYKVIIRNFITNTKMVLYIPSKILYYLKKYKNINYNFYHLNPPQKFDILVHEHEIYTFNEINSYSKVFLLIFNFLEKYNLLLALQLSDFIQLVTDYQNVFQYNITENQSIKLLDNKQYTISFYNNINISVNLVQKILFYNGYNITKDEISTRVILMLLSTLIDITKTKISEASIIEYLYYEKNNAYSDLLRLQANKIPYLYNQKSTITGLHNLQIKDGISIENNNDIYRIYVRTTNITNVVLNDIKQYIHLKDYINIITQQVQKNISSIKHKNNKETNDIIQTCNNICLYIDGKCFTGRTLYEKLCD